MNIHFISFESYPDGGAACNRHLAYLSALALIGHNIELHTLGSKKCAYKRSDIQISPIIINTNSGLSFFIKAFFELIKLVFRLLLSKNKKQIIVYLGTSGLLCLPLVIYTKIFRIPIYHERTELPSLMVGKKLLARFDYIIYKFFILRAFNAIFVISKKLQSEISKYPGVTSERVVVTNMIVDFSRFDIFERSYNKLPKIITYCGDLSSSKDGVNILISAFKKFNDIHSNCILNIIGNYDTQYFKEILQPIIFQQNIANEIKLLGFKSREEVPFILINSDILVLARPDSKQASFGFPTKLGEYLATGKPVLVTATGEITEFLVDKTDAFIVAPDSVDSFTHGLNYIYDNYEKAISVGENGYKTAKRCFSANDIAKVMIDTIEKFSGENLKG